MALNQIKPPIEISILVLDDSTMLTVASVIDPLRAANRLIRHLADQPLYRWRIYSTKGGPVRLTGDFEIKAAGAFDEIDKGKYLILIASFNQEKNADRKMLQTLRRISGRFDAICAVEAGPWLLARAGLATRHRVTTHWEDFEELSQRAPDLEVVQDRFVIDRRIWTCGGASPALDMMLKLIELNHGKTLALEVASVFIYDQTHASSDPQPSLSLGRLETSEPRLAGAVRHMESNLEAPLAVSAIAARMRLSSKTLEIIFRQHLGMTPGAYYLRLRLIAARKMVLDTSLDMQEVSLRCGFNSLSAFSRSFRKNYGLSPLKLRILAR